MDALELGTELYFFKDRLGIDASVYQNTSADQIINLPASSSSGYATRLVNGGKIQSRGIEISLRAVPVLRNNFRWNTNVNFSVNRSRVTLLPTGVDQYVTGFESLYISTDNSVFFIATPANKGRVGDIYGPSTDKNGNPVRGADIFARNGNPIEATPFLAHPNNVKDFYNTGRTFINTVSFNTGAEKANIRLSYSNLDNKGIVPNTDLKRNSFSLSGAAKMSDKISARAFINFINSSSTNRPAVGYGSENPMYTFNWSGSRLW